MIRYLRFIILGLFVFCAACAVPLRQNNIKGAPILDAPTAPVAESIYFDDEQTFSQIQMLTWPLGEWYGTRLLQLPSDFSPVKIWASMSEEYANELELTTISEEKLLAVETEAVQLISDVTAEIEQTYGAGARIDFEIKFYIKTVVTLHEGYYSLYQEDGAEQYLVFQAADYLEYAAALLESRNAEMSIVTKVWDIQSKLRSLPATYEELDIIHSQLNDLSSTAGYAMRGLPTPAPTPTRTNLVKVDITKALPLGDPDRGAELNESQACSACHPINMGGAVGPPWKATDYSDNKGIGTRAQERWQEDDYTGKAASAEEYLFESTVLPIADVVDGYIGEIMPPNYGQLLSDQDMADLIAFLLEIE